jgi:hypothetical protein
MPLVQSSKKSILHKNAAIEMKHGKKRTQAWAIAYSVMRRNKKRRKNTRTARA